MKKSTQTNWYEPHLKQEGNLSAHLFSIRMSRKSIINCVEYLLFFKRMSQQNIILRREIIGSFIGSSFFGSFWHEPTIIGSFISLYNREMSQYCHEPLVCEVLE